MIEILDVVIVIVEDGESVPVLVRGSELLVVLLLPVLIEIIDLRLDSIRDFSDWGFLVKHVNGGSQEGSNS